MAKENELIAGKEYYLDSTGFTKGTYVETKDESVFFSTEDKGYARERNGLVGFHIEGYNYKPVEDNRN